MKEQLINFLPQGTFSLIEEWIEGYSLKISISKPRKTKLGDYRYYPQSKRHQITINNNLLPELFLLTLTHEIAHMQAFEHYGRRIQPHGKEWKKVFQYLIIQTFPFFSNQTQKQLAQYAKNPKATLGSHPKLLQLLLGDKKENVYYLDELNEGMWFVINQKILKKGILKRTRYLCEEYKTNRKYWVNQSAQVKKYK